MDISLLAQELGQEDSEQYERQKAALTLLLDSPDVEAIPALLNVIHHFEDEGLLKLAIHALAKIGTDEALDALGKLMFQTQAPTKGKEAARALGYSHSIQALPSLKRLLIEGLNSEKNMPIVEALWALANLCQADIFMPDAEWEALIEAWKARGGEYNIMARHIRICWDGKIVIS